MRFICITFLICAHLASHVDLQLVKSRTVFVGRVEQNGDIIMVPNNGTESHTGYFSKNRPAGRFKQWELRRSSLHVPVYMFGEVLVPPKDAVLGQGLYSNWLIDGSLDLSMPIVMAFGMSNGFHLGDGTYTHFRMRHENNSRDIIFENFEVKNFKDIFVLNTKVGRSDVFGDITFSSDGKLAWQFTRKLAWQFFYQSVVKKYKIIVEPGMDIEDVFTSFVLFHLLNGHDIEPVPPSDH